MKRHALPLTLTVLLLAPSAARPLDPDWVATYDYANRDETPREIALCSDGGAVVIGDSWNEAINTDYATVKYDADGTELWVRRYDGGVNDHDSPYALAVGADGSIYVTGSSYGASSHFDFLTIKYSASGDSLWSARYDGSGYGMDGGADVVVDDTGNVFVTGGTEGLASEEVTTIKYDPMGTELWVSSYDGPGDSSDWAVGMCLDGAGNIYVGAVSRGSTGTEDFLVIKYDASGDTLWTSRLDVSSSTDRMLAFTIDDSGGAYATGYTWESSSLLKDYLTVRYDANGDTLWTARYDYDGLEDLAWDVAVDADGCVLVTGRGNSAETEEDVVTVKYAPDGTELWVATYDGPASGWDGAAALALGRFGKVFVAGSSEGSGTNSDILTIAYDSDGNELWVGRYDDPLNFYDTGSDVAVDGSGSPHSIGYGYVSTTTGYDFITIEYPEYETGVSGAPVVPRLSLLAPEPNPFSTSTRIAFDVPPGVGAVRVAVYDLRGRLVDVLTDKTAETGRRNVHWDGTDRGGQPVATGVYFVRAEAERTSATEKVVLIR